MIKRNGDNVFAIAPSNNQCQGGRSSVSLCPGAATRIPRATAARMTQPDAHQNTKETNIALSTYVEKWKNRYEDAERRHKTYLLKSEKGSYYSFRGGNLQFFPLFCFDYCACSGQLPAGSYANESANENPSPVFVGL